MQVIPSEALANEPYSNHVCFQSLVIISS